MMEDILGEKGALDFGFDENGELGFGDNMDVNPETENGLNLSRKESMGINNDLSNFLGDEMNSNIN